MPKSKRNEQSLSFLYSPFTLPLARPAALRSFLNALFFILSNMGLLLLETDTEANVVLAVPGEVEGAVGRTQVRTGPVPGAAPKDTVGARSADIERIGLSTR